MPYVLKNLHDLRDGTNDEYRKKAMSYRDADGTKMTGFENEGEYKKFSRLKKKFSPRGTWENAKTAWTAPGGGLIIPN